jgi:ankyrin repeat protein
MLGAESGNIRICELLIKAGGAVNTRGANGATALEFAAMNGQIDAVKYLVDHGADLRTAGPPALFLAAWRNYEGIVRFLLEKKVNPNYHGDEQGLTPLCAAAQEGLSGMTKILLTSGAEINATNNFGRTTLSLACSMGRLPVAQYLVEKGANVNSQDIEGLTPLMLAISSGQAGLVDLLLQNGANPNLRSKNGKNATDFARGNDKMREILQKHGIKAP